MTAFLESRDFTATTTVSSQPSDWLHAEGTGLPFGKSIEVDARIPLKGDSR